MSAEELKKVLINLWGVISLWVGIATTLVGVGWLYHRINWSSDTFFRPYVVLTVGIVLIISGIINSKKKLKT